jgi:3-isopropylmalate dehydrogenase
LIRRVLILPGDGIGPEVIEPTADILQATSALLDLSVRITWAELGGAAIRSFGAAFPKETEEKAREAEAILVGAVGDPAWNYLPGARRPERGLLELRASLGLYSNLRHGYVYKGLEPASPLRPELIRGTDIMVVRELNGGLYRGPHRRVTDEASDVAMYRTSEISRVAHSAFRVARRRRKKVTSVDKSPLLATSSLWRETVETVREKYADVHLEHMWVDNAAQQLVRNPGEFDVLLTEVTFGDILSDLVGGILGSIGLLPSAALGDGPKGLYEPIHGSAPRMVGHNRANPIGAIACLPMMMEHSFDLPLAAAVIRGAIQMALDEGARTKDLDRVSGITAAEMGKRVQARLEESLERARNEIPAGP